MHIPEQHVTRTESGLTLAEFADAVTSDLAALTVAEPVRPRDGQALAPGVTVSSAMQAQGDVLVTPAAVGMPYWAQALPVDRTVPLISEGNGHELRAVTRGEGRVLWAPVADDPNVIAIVEVSGDAVLLVEQPGGGHDPLGVGPGVYQIRRQRQRPDVLAAAPPHGGGGSFGWVAD